MKGEATSSQDTINSICSATQTHVNTVTKRSFGMSTETTLDCNVLSMGQFHATTVTTFPGDIQAPDAITYDDFIHVVMISDETISTLPSKISSVDREVKAAVDTSVHPPVLQLSFEDMYDSAGSMWRRSHTLGTVLVAFVAVWIV